MRLSALPVIMSLLAISLSGCFGDDEAPPQEPVETCSEQDILNETNEACYEPPALPNVLPDAVLTMTDADGRALDASTFVLVGSNITFSAAGSSDPDGSIAAVGLSIADGSGERTAQLYANGTFVDVTLPFDTAGPVNVTISVLDNAGEGVIRKAMTAVNEVFSATLSFEGPAPSGSADACEAPGASSGVPGLVTNNYALKSMVSVGKGAHWISATIADGSGEIAICAPGDPGTALSDAGTDVDTADEENATLEVGAQYYIMVLSKSNSGGDVTIETMVHFETKPAS